MKKMIFLEKISYILVLIFISLDLSYCTTIKTEKFSLFNDSDSCEKCYEFAGLIYRVITDAQVDIYIFESRTLFADLIISFFIQNF